MRSDQVAVLENKLLEMATSGQLRSQVDEPDIIRLLESTSSSVKVSVQRRRFDSDEEEDSDDDL